MSNKRGKHQKPAKRRDKAFRPKAGNAMATLSKCLRFGDTRALFGAPLCPETVKLNNARYWQALDTVKRGIQKQQAWLCLGDVLSITLMLCEQGLGEEYTDDVAHAIEALARARQRGAKTGRYLLDGDAFAAIGQALQVHDAQTEIATQDDILKAERRVRERIAQGEVYLDTPTPNNPATERNAA